MQVFYKCACQAEEQALDVPARRPGIGVSSWMELVAICITFDHGWTSPHCTAEVMTHVRVPVGSLDDAVIGDAVAGLH